jgi:dihydrofolate reductase
MHPAVVESRAGQHPRTGRTRSSRRRQSGRSRWGDPDWYVGNYELQVPIFVVTHQPPDAQPKQDEHLTFTFVTDGVESAIVQATAAAGDKAVRVVGGVDTSRQLLRAGLVDELQIGVMPVLFGAGLRLFDNEGLEQVQLEKIGVDEIGARTSLSFRVAR